MSVKLYADHHLHFEIVRGLRALGVDVLTAQDDGMESGSDHEIFDRATHLGRAVISQDEDFLVLAAERQRNSVHFLGLIYAHQLRVTIGNCIEGAAIVCLASRPGEFDDQVIHLPF